LGSEDVRGKNRKTNPYQENSFFFSRSHLPDASQLLSSSSLRQERGNLHDFFITFSSAHSHKASFSFIALSIIQLGKLSAANRGGPGRRIEKNGCKTVGPTEFPQA